MFTCEAPQSLFSPPPLPSPTPSWSTISLAWHFFQCTIRWVNYGVTELQTLFAYSNVETCFHLAKNLLCTAGSKCESNGGRSYLRQNLVASLLLPFWWARRHLPYNTILEEVALTCISLFGRFSSCPSHAWLGWFGQLLPPFSIFSRFLLSILVFFWLGSGDLANYYSHFLLSHFSCLSSYFYFSFSLAWFRWFGQLL